MRASMRGADAPRRRRAAGLPTPVTPEERRRLAGDLVDRARDRAVPHRATPTHTGYGDVREFRPESRARNEPHVLAVTPTESRAIAAGSRILGVGDRVPGARGGRRPARPHPPTDAVTPSAHDVADWAMEASGWRAPASRSDTLRVRATVTDSSGRLKPTGRPKFSHNLL